MSVTSEQKAYLQLLRTTGQMPRDTERPNFNGLDRDIKLIEKTAVDSGGNIRRIEDTITLLSRANADLAELAKEEPTSRIISDDQLYPSLPPDVAIPPGATDGLCPLKDEYIQYSKTKSPEGYEEFHASCFWSILSTIAGRRISINLDTSTRQYTSLFVVLAARSTLFAKTETAEVTRLVLKECGLDWLLGSTRITPQKLLLDMSGPVPENYNDMDIKEQGVFAERLAMSAQRGWLYNELGKLIKSMMQSTGPMAEFSSILLQISDCPDELSSGTVHRGNEAIVNPYLSLLGTLTPASIKTVAGRHAELWSDGLFARFLWSCPPPDKYLDQPFGQGKTKVPDNLVSSLQQWHKDLGIPRLTITPIMEKVKNKDKVEEEQPTGRYRKEWTDELKEKHLSLSPVAYESWRRYRTALKDMIVHLPNHDLDASYGRLNMMALRVAALAASLDGVDQIEREHWMLGQEQAEMWRASLHRLYAQVNADAEMEDIRTAEDALVNYLDALGKSTTVREIQRCGPPLIRALKSDDIREMLKSLIRNGVVEQDRKQNSKTEWYIHIKHIKKK